RGVARGLRPSRRSRRGITAASGFVGCDGGDEGRRAAGSGAQGRGACRCITCISPSPGRRRECNSRNRRSCEKQSENSEKLTAVRDDVRLHGQFSEYCSLTFVVTQLAAA